MTVVAFDSPRSPDLVFCPLQKQWVAKSLPVKVRSFPLAGICAPSKDKAAFVSALALRALAKGTAKRPFSEDLFFNFQAKGERALTDDPSAPESPGQQLTPVKLMRDGGAGGRSTFTAATVQIFSLNRPLLRPSAKTGHGQNPSGHNDLKTISHAILGRAPPVLL